MKDNFSKRAVLYAQFRPDYPIELIDYIVGFVKEKELAWDCGTGNGQSAKLLSRYFQKVYATDISKKQLANAHPEPNIKYAVEPAEKINLADGSVDLITVAQAIHWFNFENFYAEVNRVAKPGAVIAVWMYNLLRISTVIDKIVEEYYYETLKGYWDPERKYVDDGYRGIPFPFKEIETKPFNIELSWSQEELGGYFNTWSALQKYLAIHPDDPVTELMNKIKPHWGNSEKRKIVFPIRLRLGIIA